MRRRQSTSTLEDDPDTGVVIPKTSMKPHSEHHRIREEMNPSSTFWRSAPGATTASICWITYSAASALVLIFIVRLVCWWRTWWVASWLWQSIRGCSHLLNPPSTGVYLCDLYRIEIPVGLEAMRTLTNNTGKSDTCIRNFLCYGTKHLSWDVFFRRP